MKLYMVPLAPNPTKVMLYIAEREELGTEMGIEQVVVNTVKRRNREPNRMKKTHRPRFLRSDSAFLIELASQLIANTGFRKNSRVRITLANPRHQLRGLRFRRIAVEVSADLLVVIFHGDPSMASAFSLRSTHSRSDARIRCSITAT